jgi:anaerobic selenocysteine-containing dehydrogenase/Fe-S-cluster-containing dehydrogenase component
MSSGLSRRSFLKLAASAGAAAAVPGCEPAARKLVPYVVADPNVTPGIPSFFATICNECPAGCGLLATVREGRATHLDGNPEDPISQGSICARGQAGLQGIYNPDRLPHPMSRNAGGTLARVSWDAAMKTVNAKLAAASKAGKDRVAFLGGAEGPSIRNVVSAFTAANNSSRVLYYSPFSNQGMREASETLFGRSDLPSFRIDQAEVLISFGANFLETWISPVEFGRQYSEFRAPKERRGTTAIGRAFYVGPRMSTTAAKCDEWIAAGPGAETEVAFAILGVMLKQRWVSQNSGVDLDALGKLVASYDAAAVSQRTGVPVDTISRMAEEFGKADGALAISGSDDPASHLAAFVLNSVTGNFGKTVMFLQDAPQGATNKAETVKAFVDDMRAGKVDVLVVAGTNPVYSMPPEYRAAEALQKVPFVVWAGGVPDETAAMANLLLPMHHPLESWRDRNPRAGVWGLGQPVMQPVFNSRDLGDILLSTIQNPKWATSADAVKATWQDLGTKAGGSFDDFWTKARREGGLFQDQHVADVKLNLSSVQAPAPHAAPEISLYSYPHIFLYDGRGADKPWLQELPEPISQIVWDNWAEIHPDTARKLEITDNAIIELKTDFGVIRAPALVRPTVMPGVIAIAFGQGHTAMGRYAANVGANPFAVLGADRMSASVTVRATGDSRKLVTPLGKSEQLGRSIIEAMTIEQLAAGEVPESHEPEIKGPYEFYPAWDYPKHKWGMTIDVNACIGCSSCVTACYAENNVPFVGKQEVDNGRIMSWIRIERFYPEAHEENPPLMYLAPILCQQCDHAPCEPVCPVFASYHTEEGLNGQVYNRCVGTRYCENNCPYKVRRFNWYLPEWPTPLNLQLNPDVTVRGAGVMEKCTFCIQRIQYAELDALQEKRNVRDGEIVPACAQACPAHAITFGDMKDPASAMMRRRDQNQLRNYRMLTELNTLPAVVYLRDLHSAKGKA